MNTSLDISKLNIPPFLCLNIEFCHGSSGHGQLFALDSAVH
jgi:hypothetical protein